MTGQGERMDFHWSKT